MLLLVTLAGFAASAALTFHFILNRPIQSDSAVLKVPTASLHKPETVEEVSYGLPMRLKIPKINIDARLDNVGLTPQGDLDVPKGPANAAWYHLGVRPGQKGSSVIVGHFGYKNRIPAVFDNLHKLQEGDNLYVEDEKGATISFVVRESRKYEPNADASSVFLSNDGKAHLNLITCQGVWNETQKSYSTRLVVFADKET
ncbi:MAG: class F sortase [Candidatus Saccharimonadales bacterium]